MMSLEEPLPSSLEWMSDLTSMEDYVSIMLKCKNKKDLAYAKCVHTNISEVGLDTHTSLGNFLVPMFVECGSMFNARKVFNRLVHRNEHSWTFLIQGYTQCEEPQHALYLFQKMQEESVVPSTHTLVAVLKACARLKWLETGQLIHAKVAGEGYECDRFIGNILIDLYAKCGLLPDAQKVFDEMTDRNVVTWTTILSGYAEGGLAEEALDCLEQMQQHGVPPNSITLLCCLKACCTERAIDLGQKMHAKIIGEGFEEDSYVGNALVDMYAKCGSLVEACEVFDELPIRDVVSWTALITGYTEHGHGEEALSCFEQMQVGGMCPNAVAFACVLRACGSIGALESGQGIHTDIVKQDAQDFLIGNILVDMYAKCGALKEAREIFNELPDRDVVSWNTLIAGYAEHGFVEDAFTSLEQMEAEGISPNDVTFVCFLKACGSIRAVDRGQEVHGEIAKEGFERDSFVCNTLIDMYARCGLLTEAHAIFDELPVKNVVCWTALITGYVEQGLGEEALLSLEQMRLEGVSPNAVTLVCGLKACSIIDSTEKGQKIHADIIKAELESNLFVGNTLVDMYAKFAFLAESHRVFTKLPVCDVISWNTLLSGYAEHGHGEKALKMLDQMKLQGMSPSATTFICGLKACGSIGAISRGQELHAEIVKKGFEGDAFVCSTAVDMYAKCRSLAEAQDIFDKLPARDVVSWNALVGGYAEQGCVDEALNCFKQMQVEGLSPVAVSWNALIEVYAEQGKSEKALEFYAQMQQQGLWPDSATFLSVLKACSNTSALEIGKKVHAQILAVGATKISLATALIDMYGKCGSITNAQQVFDEMAAKDLLMWTVLITGYTRQGESKLAVSLFDQMRERGIQPDGVVFLSVLTACSHAGLVHMGLKYFEAMSKVYGITPTIEHHSCMVDLLGRAGQLDMAVDMLKKLPCQADDVAWSTILGACRKWGNVELGRHAFDCALKLVEKHDGMYITMFNIYADAHMWEDAKEVMAMRVIMQTRKEMGKSWIEVDGIVHRFVIKDPQTIALFAKLKQAGDTKEEMVGLDGLLETSDDAMEDVSCGHTEKLALACGLINLPKGRPVRFIKNQWLCKSCHAATALVSKDESRTVICRDAICFHVFSDGKCSCGK